MNRIENYIVNKKVVEHIEYYLIDPKGKTEKELMRLEGFEVFRGNRFIWWNENEDGTYQLKIFRNTYHILEQA